MSVAYSTCLDPSRAFLLDCKYIESNGRRQCGGNGSISVCAYVSVRMHECVRACVSVCMHECVHACARACVCACVCTCMCACACVCACVHVCACMCVCVCVRACVCMLCACVCVCVCVCTSMHVFTCAHVCVLLSHLQCRHIMTFYCIEVNKQYILLQFHIMLCLCMQYIIAFDASRHQYN